MTLSLINPANAPTPFNSIKDYQNSINSFVRNRVVRLSIPSRIIIDNGKSKVLNMILTFNSIKDYHSGCSLFSHFTKAPLSIPSRIIKYVL